MQVDRQTLGHCLRKAAEVFGDRPFARCGTREISFVEADRAVDALATELQARGVEAGTRVAMLLPNILEFPLCFLALARLGALTIPIGTRYTALEVADLLTRSRATLLIAFDEVAPSAGAAVLTAAAEALGGEHRIWRLPQGMKGAALWGDAPTARPIAEVAEPEDPVVAVFTSGTSGVPKAAVHSHRVLRNVSNIAKALDLGPRDVILAHMPFNHVAGLFAAILAALVSGASLSIVRRWDASEVAAQIERDTVTVFGGIPTHFIDLIEAVKVTGHNMSSLRTAWIGGAAISPDLARRALSILSLGSLQAIYGMTETTSTTTLTPIGAPIDYACANKGRVIGDFDVGVFDCETGRQLPAGHSGEVRVRGHVVMIGYLDDLVATRDAITTDGWFRTGDLGRFDQDGFLAIEGRLKDVFRVGGSTVSPAEVERALAALDGVRQAVVVGVPDDRLGEVGVAFVQPEPGRSLDPAAISAALVPILAGFKRPRIIQCINEFPLTSTGKISRAELTARAVENTHREPAGAAA